MIKSIFLIAFSMVLSFSVLAPSLVALLNLEEETIVLADLGEEETQSELEEMEVVVFGKQTFTPSYFTQNKYLNLYSIENRFSFSSEVVLPPPEQFI